MPDTLTDDQLFRFGGIARLYGQSALKRFLNSHVAVIGLGGVGSWAAESLVRSGIGTLTLFDLDEICVSNINRQIHALNGTVGQAKVNALKARFEEIHPECRVNAELQFITAKNLEQIDQRFDYVIDAIDSVKAKMALLAHCQRRKIKIITAGGAGGLQDPREIQTADLSRTFHDPLLAKVRKGLRQDFNFPTNPKRRFGIEAVFSAEQPHFPMPDGEVCRSKPGSGSEPLKLDCASGYGACTAVTASFGLVASARVLQKLAGSDL